ncbi:MAG: hypothetical protein A3E51_06045 [Burkholderiales bacterium RIFCSPHIGHO2_12_FULL_67_38]|nr:MAG: hypothetical protein A3I64_16355 [Burkholderiales bacterium RIFCSPLOWO2_02_FULL_67_64]OGB35776.1 MAG: hypothetical protein A3E51_06045 [Burkholderiales bacterium RIFCSPHIGHO2_12_FULL_67_38]OGB92422.1 MAG: hypothetical protein A3G82_18205 [Burkholderiales bacterium RIFCSPLOWO2_12_FULL_67_210]
MSNPTPLFTLRQTAVWLAAAATLGLAGCAVPYPVYEQQPMAQEPVQVQTYPSQREQRRDYRRRQNETLYEAEVLSVRAVMGQPEQRCWMEREQVPQRPAANVGGAIVGAVIGGVIGHQIGGGSGRDLATAGGVVAGAAIGSQVGRDRYGNPVSTQEVQRCSTVNSQSEPAYWDVTYRFRGITHRAQMLSPPGRSLTVNGNGEPRE